MAILQIRPIRLRKETFSYRPILFAGLIATALTALIHPIIALLGVPE